MARTYWKSSSLFSLLLVALLIMAGYGVHQSRTYVVRYDRTYYETTDYETGVAQYEVQVTDWTEIRSYVYGHRQSRYLGRRVAQKSFYYEVKVELTNRMPVPVTFQALAFARALQGNYHAEEWTSVTVEANSKTHFSQRIPLPLGELTQFEAWQAHQVEVAAPEVSYPVVRTACRWSRRTEPCYTLWQDCYNDTPKDLGNCRGKVDSVSIDMVLQ